MRVLILSLFFILSCLGLARPAFAWDLDEIDLFRRHRFGVHLGFSSFTYSERRQFQPTLAKDDRALSAPTLIGTWQWWLIRSRFQTFSQLEVSGVMGQVVKSTLGFGFHHFTQRGWHAVLAFAPEATFRFEPELGLGYSNVFGGLVQVGLGYRWDLLSSYPKEILLQPHYSKPFFGKSLSSPQSYGFGASLSYKFPISKPTAFPTLFFERVMILSAKYETSETVFRDVRTVTTWARRWMLTLGYEF